MIGRRLRLSLRTALIGVNLVVLVLPLAGVALMRLYESALVRQTESALIAQGAFIAAFYRSLIAESGTQNFVAMSRALPEGVLPSQEDEWYPRAPTLDLADSPVLPPFPDPKYLRPPIPEAEQIGARLNPTLKDAQLTTLAGIRVVDIHGTVIASTADDLGTNIAAGEEVAAALRGEPASRIRSKDDVVADTPLDSFSRSTRVRVFITQPIILHERLIGAVLLSRTPPNIVQALYGKRVLLLTAAACLILLVVLMSGVTHRLITRPLSRLVTHSEAINRGALGLAARMSDNPPPRLKEIDRLQRAIIDMARTLEDRAAYLQDFARHVSHEFKTPLAGIRGAIEVLEDHRANMSDDQLARFLKNIEADTNRLTLLTEGLNSLTQAQMRPLALARGSVADVAAEVCSSDWPLEFSIDPALDALVVPIDQAALTAALTTLFDNAHHHGATRVTLTRRDRTLLIENDGAPISDGNAEQLFVPFFTTRREGGGSGLGLVIARTLTERMDATLTLDCANPVRFAVSF